MRRSLLLIVLGLMAGSGALEAQDPGVPPADSIAAKVSELLAASETRAVQGVAIGALSGAALGALVGAATCGEDSSTWVLGDCDNAVVLAAAGALVGASIGYLIGGGTKRREWVPIPGVHPTVSPRRTGGWSFGAVVGF